MNHNVVTLRRPRPSAAVRRKRYRNRMRRRTIVP